MALREVQFVEAAHKVLGYSHARHYFFTHITETF